MKIHPDCYPCLSRQVPDAARAAGADEDLCRRILDRVAAWFPDVPEDWTPPHVARVAQLILSKGQGNYETLSDAPGNVYFLFKVKCAAVALETGMRQGSYMLVRKEAGQGY